MITPENILYVFLSIGVFSFALYKETSYYRLCEHLLLGVTMGYTTVSTIKTLMTTAINPLASQGEIIYVIPILLGLSLYTRFSKETRWISRVPIAVLVGVGMAIATRGALSAYIISQTRATATLNVMTPDVLTNINNLFGLIVTAFVLVFFTFTFGTGETNTTFSRTLIFTRKTARLFIMVAFGAFFASIGQSHLTLLAGSVRRILMALGLI